MEEYLRAGRLVLDTSVLIEYIVRRAPYRDLVGRIFEAARRGGVRLYASPITLSETLYVASRIYEAASLTDPNGEALNYILWLRGLVGVTSIDEDLALRAGELKKSLRIALPDCYVIATAERIGAKPLFKKLEEEMKPVESILRRHNVLFLETRPPSKGQGPASN